MTDHNLRETPGATLEDDLTRSLTNAIRTTLGVSGLVSILVGILILVWPGRTAAVVAAIIAVWAVIAGLAALAAGMLSRKLGVWPRIGQLALGVVFLVPQAAVTQTEQGYLVFLAVDGKVAPRPVQVGPWQGKDWVILSGLQTGDQVIVDNLMKLRPGAPVAPHPPQPAAGVAADGKPAPAAPPAERKG